MAETTKTQPKWYALTVEAAAKELQVDPAKGLSASEAQQRLQKYGPNELAAKKKESGWQAFLRQYKDFMQIILLGAAVLNLVFTQSWSTTIVLVVLTVFNAVLGLRGESKAEASLAALTKMMKNIARVRRDGQAIEIEAEQLVPGDVVLMEAGQPRAGGRPPIRDGNSRDRGSCPDRRKRGVFQGHRDHRQTRSASGRPPLHGLHEHFRHPRPR